MSEGVSSKGKGKSGKALSHLELTFAIVLSFLTDFANLLSNHLETFTSTAKEDGNWQYLKVGVVAVSVCLSTAVFALGHPERLSVSRDWSKAEKEGSDCLFLLFVPEQQLSHRDLESIRHSPFHTPNKNAMDFPQIKSGLHTLLLSLLGLKACFLRE